VSITAPPRPPRPEGLIDPDELEALVEALIEEARRRTRRRRRRNGGYALLTLLVGVGFYFGVGRGGGGPNGASVAAASSANGSSGSRNRVGVWEPSNGPYGGPAYVVAVAPSVPDVVYAGTERGVFRSVDGGRRWASAGLTGPAVSRLAYPPSLPGVTSLVVDPRSPRTVYAGRNGTWQGGATYQRPIFRSSDGGRTWHTLAVKGQPVAISPTSPETVYAATGGPRGVSRLLRSTDGGRRWRSADAGLPHTYLWSVTFDPAEPTTVYAATGTHGLYESDDSGGRWHPVQISVPHREVTAVAVDPARPQSVLAATDSGVTESSDGGHSWRLLNAAMGGHGRDRGYMQVTALLFAPHDPRTIYATTNCTGVFKSTDGGRRWSPTNTGLQPGCPWRYTLAADPRASGVLYAAEPGRGVLKSSDGGARWRLTNDGIAVSTIAQVAVDPQRTQTVYAAARSLGAFKSTDGGAHWQALRSGIERVDAVAVDPANPSTVVVAGSPGGLGRTTDGGRTWRRIPFGTRDVIAIAVSRQTIYVATPTSGLFASSDSGRTWRKLGPTGLAVRTLALAPGAPTTLYAGGDSLGASGVHGLFRSGDGGAAWKSLTGTLAFDVSAIAIDPHDPSTLYVGTDGAEGGVFESADAGTTWHQESTGLTWRTRSRDGKLLTPTLGISSLVIDPANPTTLYAATGWRGVYTTTNRGQSWHPFDTGLDDHAVTTLALDTRAHRLYGGTAAGGIVRIRLSR
jgi:photosystem II stability/assembly factor-like uncharacterized protein